jgi:hypothetical protein
MLSDTTLQEEKAHPLGPSGEYPDRALPINSLRLNSLNAVDWIKDTFSFHFFQSLPFSHLDSTPAISRFQVRESSASGHSTATISTIF